MIFASIKIPGAVHPINPVLDAFREHVVVVGKVNTAVLAQEWLDHFPHYWHYWRRGRIPARKAHREQARRVFARIVAVLD